MTLRINQIDSYSVENYKPMPASKNSISLAAQEALNSPKRELTDPGASAKRQRVKPVKIPLTRLEEAIERNQIMIARHFKLNILAHQRTSKGITFLEMAYYYAHIEMIGLFIEAGVSVNSRLSSGATLLGQAFHDGYLDLAAYLLDKDADPDSCFKDTAEGTALHACINSFRPDLLEIAIELGANLNAPNRQGLTPLALAVAHGQSESIAILLEAGADPLQTNGEEHRLITLLLEEDHLDLLEEDTIDSLLKGDYDIQDHEGDTLLMLAAKHRCASFQDLLLRKNASIHIKNDDGQNLLHIIIQEDLSDLLSIVVPLCDADTLNAVDTDGNTPIMVAVQLGSIDCLELLLRQGATITIENHNKQTLLHLLAEAGMLVQLRTLLPYFEKETINAADAYGNTPIMLAAKRADNACVKFLQEQGALLTASNNEKKTLLHILASNGKIEWLRGMIGFFTAEQIDAPDADDNTPLFFAAKRGSIKCVEFLIEAGANRHHRNALGEDLLHLLASSGLTGVISTLHLSGAIDLNSLDNLGKTPLMKAAERNNTSCIELLLKLGADVNITTPQGTSVLNSLVRGTDAQLVELVLSRCVNPKRMIDTPDKNGATLLMIAIECGLESVVNRLISYGADLTQTDSRGWNLAHYVASKSNSALVGCLASLSLTALNAKDSEGNTPLLVAIQNNHFNAIPSLLTLGADPTIANGKLLSSFHEIVLKQDIKLVAEVLSYFKTVLDGNRFKEAMNAKNSKGETPLTTSVICYPFNLTLFEYLLSEGAEIEQIRIDHLPLLYFHPQLRAYQERIRIHYSTFIPQTDEEQKNKEKCDKLMQRIPQIQAYHLSTGTTSRTQIESHFKSVVKVKEIDETIVIVINWIAKIKLFGQLHRSGIVHLTPVRVDNLYSSESLLENYILEWLKERRMKSNKRLKSTILVAEDENETQGIAIYSQNNELIDLNYLVTNPKNLDLKPSKRAVRGSGTAIIRHIAQIALAKNIPAITLHSVGSALSWYVRLGFKANTETQSCILEGKYLVQ